jgi:hypothetical protein
MGCVNFDPMMDKVEHYACEYEEALELLVGSASGADSANGNIGTVKIAEATIATTTVQVTQALTEMASGIVKNAADHLKGKGRALSG